MSTLESLDPSILFVMMKGEPGTRKSTCALSFPTPQYWFSWDRKMNGLLIPMRNWGIDPKLIVFDDYDNYDKGRIKMEQLQVNCPYKTIIVDSITTAADASLRQVRKGKGTAKKVHTIPVDGLEEFNAEAASLSEMVALLKDIHTFHKVNVILIAHELQVDYKSVTGETHMSRTIVTAAKKIAAKRHAGCGEVYHHNMKKGFEADASGQYALFTEHTGDDFARTALPLDREIVFGGEQLYDKYLMPAIKKLQQAPQIVTKF